MIITSINSNAQNQKPSFGQIKPEHLFIRMHGYAKDFDWVDEMIDTINISKRKIINGKVDFRGILNFIAERYKFCFQSIKGKERFGIFRDSSIITPIMHRRYTSYRDRVAEIIKEHGKKNESLEWSSCSFSFRKITSSQPKTKNIPVKADSYRQYVYVDGERVPATTSYRIFDVDNKFEIINNSQGKKEAFIWFHTPPEFIPKLLKKANNLYLDIVECKSSNVAKVTKKIGKLHWVLVQTCPFLRGSAGIADVLTKTLFESKNIQVSRWKKGIAPDLEVLTRPMNEYAKGYIHLFETPPKYLYEKQ